VAEPTPGTGSGGEIGPNRHAPKPQFEYRAPSLLWEHRYLAVIFVLVLIVATVSLFRAPHKPMIIDPPPVYVEPIPQPASSAH
jgi:hypothetical protein